MDTYVRHTIIPIKNDIPMLKISGVISIKPIPMNSDHLIPQHQAIEFIFDFL